MSSSQRGGRLEGRRAPLRELRTATPTLSSRRVPRFCLTPADSSSCSSSERGAHVDFAWKVQPPGPGDNIFCFKDRLRRSFRRTRRAFSSISTTWGCLPPEHRRSQIRALTLDTQMITQARA